MIELSDHSPFRELSDEGKQLLRKARVRRVAPDDGPILHQGQRISGAYFVLEGRLRVYSLSPGGGEATLYLINPGETCVLALNSLFNDLLYPAWVEAERKTRVALIPGDTFRTLFSREPAIQDATVRALSTLVFGLMAELEELHSCTVEQRLANFILLRATSDGELRMTQQQIANHLGTTREVVARLVGRLVAQRLVATGRGVIRVVDAARLARIVGR